MIAGQILHGGETAQRRIKFRLQARAGKDDPALATGGLDDPLVSVAFTVGQGHMLAGPGEALSFEPVLDLFEFLVEEVELLVDGVTAFDELGEVDFRLCYLFFHRLGSFDGQVVHPVFFRPGSVPQIPADSRNENEKSLKIPMIIILTGSRNQDAGGKNGLFGPEIRLGSPSCPWPN